jgi:malate permease and related proteins
MEEARLAVKSRRFMEEAGRLTGERSEWKDSLLLFVLEIFTQVCLPLMVVVGAGWLMDRKFSLHLESLVKLNLYLLVPAFIFARIIDTPLGGREAGMVMLSVFTVLILCGLISSLISAALGLETATRKAHALASMLGNSGNFGIPLVTLAFGQEAAAVQVYVLVTMNISTFTVGVFLANSTSTGGWRGHLRALKATLRQPSLYALAAAALCKTFSVPVQTIGWLWEPVDMIAAALVGFALLTLGVQLSQTQPAPLRAPLVSALSIRLLLAPVLAWMLTAFIPLEPAAQMVLILAAGAPVAVNSALLAHEFGGDRRFATASVFYSTLLSMITVTVILAVLKRGM